MDYKVVNFDNEKIMSVFCDGKYYVNEMYLDEFLVEMKKRDELLAALALEVDGHE